MLMLFAAIAGAFGAGFLKLLITDGPAVRFVFTGGVLYMFGLHQTEKSRKLMQRLRPAMRVTDAD